MLIVVFPFSFVCLSPMPCFCFPLFHLLVPTSDPAVDLPEIKGTHRKFRSIVSSIIGMIVKRASYFLVFHSKVNTVIKGNVCLKNTQEICVKNTTDNIFLLSVHSTLDNLNTVGARNLNFSKFEWLNVLIHGETWGFPVVRLGCTRLPVIVNKKCVN